MDKERLNELSEKRRRLQEEIKFKEKREEVANEIEYLEEMGEPFKLYYVAEHFNWIVQNVKTRKRDGYRGIHGDFQIDVVDREAISFAQIEDSDSVQFSEITLAHIPKGEMLVVCHQSRSVEIEISVHAFLSKPSVFFSTPQTWGLAMNRRFMIEYLWEQGVIRLIKIDGSTPSLTHLFEIN